MTHPGRSFAWTDERAMRDFVRDTAFAQLSGVVDGRPVTAHAPLSVATTDGTIGFHLARANAFTRGLDGAAVVASVIGTPFYVSPDWYGTANQVPTWNYRLVEIEGIARLLDAAELRAQVDALSAAQEAQLSPKPAWTSARMEPRTLDLMLRAILGFAIEAPVLRGMIKMGQNKTVNEATGAMAGLRALGNERAANAMAAAR